MKSAICFGCCLFSPFSVLPPGLSDRLKGYALLLLVLVGVGAGVGIRATPLRAETIRELSDGQRVAIIGSAAGILILGHVVAHFDGDSTAKKINQLNGVDRWFRHRLRGSVRAGGGGSGSRPGNFLDTHGGSVITPLISISALAVMDLRRHEFSRDIPFFLAGHAVTTGLSGLAKSLFSRPRPYLLNEDHPRKPDRDHYRAFFSGHASSAFYSATFFNQRFRSHMRQNWTTAEYRTGRWLSPLVAFGWASCVGYSRIHADKHYFTDVAAGALVGTLVAELFYRLNYEKGGESVYPSGENGPMWLTINIPLP